MQGTASAVTGTRAGAHVPPCGSRATRGLPRSGTHIKPTGGAAPGNAADGLTQSFINSPLMN